MTHPDYHALFEEHYRRLRARDASGYNDPELYRDSLAKVVPALARHYIVAGRILELGCGAGDLALLLAQRGHRTAGVDIAPTAIAWARAKAAASGLKADFQVGNVLDLPYPDGHFDAVIDALCWHCNIGADRKTFLRQVHRVLKADGLFIAMTKCGTPPPDYPFDPATRCKVENGVATRYWGLPETLAWELTNSGFKILRSVVYDTHNQDLFFAEATPQPLEGTCI